MAEVLKSTFEGMLPSIEKCIEECSFYAIDLEMTGITLEDHKISFGETSVVTDVHHS